MNRTATVLVLVLLLVGTSASANNAVGASGTVSTGAGGSAESPAAPHALASGYTDVNVSQAKQMIESTPGLVILDVRTQAEYDSGHLQNATLIPVDELAGRLGELNKNEEILVYCKGGTRSAIASQTLANNGFLYVYNMLGGITAWMSAGYWIEIIHNGDLIISGTQTFLIQNCFYIQTGNINVKDSSALTITNAQVTVNQSYTGQFDFSVENNASLEADNLTIESDSPIEFLDIQVKDNASATVNGLRLSSGAISGHDNSVLNISSSIIAELGILDNSNVSVSDSEITGLTDFYFDKFSAFTLADLKPGLQTAWNLDDAIQGVLHPLCQLTLKNTTVDHWSIDVDADAAVTVENCTIERFVIEVFDADLQLNAINATYYPSWNLKSIELVNSSITGMWIFGLHNSTVTATNSTVNFNLFDESDATINDSRTFWIAAFNQSGKITFERAIMAETATLTRIEEPRISFYSSNILLSGNIVFVHPQILAWSSSNVTRDYNVVTENMTGIPIEDAELTLYDQNSTVVWSGLTDASGMADFNLTFTDSNYTDTLRLEAVKGNLSSVTTVSFLSDTPVTLGPGAHDIAAADVSPAKTVVGQGLTLPINVTVVNGGDFPENFTVTGYANTTSIGTQAVINLPGRTSRNLTLSWDTVGLAYGNYTLSATASPVPNETDTTNNNCNFNGYVLVTITGDVDGNFKVDMTDIMLILSAFGSRMGQPRYIANCDIDSNSQIDMSDVMIALGNFGRYYPYP